MVAAFRHYLYLFTVFYHYRRTCSWIPQNSVSLKKRRSCFSTYLCAATVQGVTLKIAVDATGAAADLAETKSERFTCEESLDMVHRLRKDSCAVLVGRGTVVADNPSLTVRRIPSDTQPIRVVIDPRLNLLSSDKSAEPFSLFSDNLPTIVYHSVEDINTQELNVDGVVSLVYIKPSLSDENQGTRILSPTAVVRDLKENQGLQHVMVEGGPLTARQFLSDMQVDRALIVKAPLCFREPLPAGLSENVLESAGLVKLGSIPSDVDEIDCWSRPGLPWPTTELSDWP